MNRTGFLFAAVLCAAFGAHVLTGCSESVETVQPKPDSVTALTESSPEVTLSEPMPDPGVTANDVTGTEATLLLPGDVPLVLVRIPAGSFMMGRYPGEQDSYSNEDPQHPVTLSQDFYMGRYEVTKRQWQAVMGTMPWSGLLYVLNDLDSPAVYVSWNDAQSFITALNTHITNTSQGAATFRLPSEAEWEYACRAGTTTRFYWGDDPSYTQISDYAWREETIIGESEVYARLVGLKLPNAFGLYDMSGNVFEWCEDDYHISYTGAPTNSSAWVDSPRGSYRLLRGGAWCYDGYYCRSVHRDYRTPDSAYNNHGFRVVRTP